MFDDEDECPDCGWEDCEPCDECGLCDNECEGHGDDD